MDSFQAKPYTKKGADQTQAGDPPDKIYRREENMPSKYLEPLRNSSPWNTIARLGIFSVPTIS